MRKLLFVALAAMSFSAFAGHDGRYGSPHPNERAYQHANTNARFLRGDLNHDGRISRYEAEVLRQQVNRRYNGSVPVAAMDRNRDGYISKQERKEFRRMMERRREARQEWRDDRRDRRW